MSLTVLVGGPPRYSFLDKRTDSDSEDLQEDETWVWNCLECSPPSSKPSPGSLSPVQSAGSGPWNTKPSKIPSLDMASFTTIPEVKETAMMESSLTSFCSFPEENKPNKLLAQRSQGCMASSSTNPVVEEKADFDSEEFQEWEIWACMEDSPPNAKTFSPHVYSAKSGIGIFQPSAAIDIPGCRNKRTSKIDADFGDDKWIPPHEFLKMRRAAYAGFPWSFSICPGIGGRNDTIMFRNAILRVTRGLFG